MTFMQRLRKFARDTKAHAALEFALLAPFIMVPLLFGSMEIIDAVLLNRRVQNVAASLADVTARDTEISNDEVTGLWSAANVLMFPKSSTPLRLRITSITIVDSETAEVLWSEGHGMTARSAGDVITGLDDAMMQPGTNIILGEAEYSYTPTVGLVLDHTMTLTGRSFRRSRMVDPIPRVS